MVLKKINPAVEYAFSVIGSGVRGAVDLGKIPLKLLNEMVRFNERNSLAVVAYSVEKKKPISKCCEACLKAHMIKKARDLGLGRRVLGEISNMFDCGRGHEGYYMDGERLVKI